MMKELFNIMCVFIISMATRNDYESRGAAIPGGGWKDTPTDDIIKQRVINACRCYAAWSPRNGAYAIGYHSVSRQFDQFLANPFHYLHSSDFNITSGQLGIALMLQSGAGLLSLLLGDG